MFSNKILPNIKLSHEKLISRIKELGYPETAGGCCYGLAVTAIQFALFDDLPRFYNLISILKTDNLLNKIKKAEQKRLRIHHNYKLNNIQRIKVKGLEELNDTDKLLLEVKPFLDSISLIQSPDDYRGLFEEPYPGQKVELTLPLTLRKILIEKKEFKSLSSDQEPLIDTFKFYIGIYNKNQLKKYLDKLTVKLNKHQLIKPITLLLGSSNHAIAIYYVNKSWSIIDANNLTLKKEVVTDNFILAKKIISAFSKNEYATFDSTVICFKDDKRKLENLFNNNNKLEVINKSMLEKMNITSHDSHGATVLLIAAKKGHFKFVEQLIRAGVNVNLTMDNGATPLFMAAQNGHYEVVKILLNARADISKTKKDGTTPMLVAAFKGDVGTVRILIKYGADVCKSRKDGLTPLFVAASKGDIEVVDHLLKAGAEINLALDSGETPLFVAVENGHFEVIEHLLKNGAYIDKARKDGVTPLFMAVLNGHCKVVKMLLTAGADVNRVDIYGATPLFIAEAKGYKQLVKMLQEKIKASYSSKVKYKLTM